MAQEQLGEVAAFGGDPKEGLRDFWSVYDAQYEAISHDLLDALASHPEIAGLLEGMTPEAQKEQNERSRELMRRAIVENEWDTYWDNLRTQGQEYAHGGLSFPAWFAVTREFRKTMRRRLSEAFASSPHRSLRALDAVDDLMDEALAVIGEEYLNTKQNVITQQQEALRELSTPVLPLRPGLLILPLVGVIDSHRAKQITENLLEAIPPHRAKAVVMDITGVPAVDSMVANHLIQTAQAARLMGATVIVTGISTVNAQTLVRIGIDPTTLNAVGDLQSGFEVANGLLGRDPATAAGSDSPAGLD